MKYKLNKAEVEFLKNVKKTGNTQICGDADRKDTCIRLFSKIQGGLGCPGAYYSKKSLKARATYILNRQDK